MLYHYTDPVSAAGIRRDGVIRSRPWRVYRDLAARGPSLELPPVVWLTTNPVMDGTVLVTLTAGGRVDPVGRLHRVLVHPDLTDTGLAEWVEARGHDLDWFAALVQTGMLAGSHYTTWRLFDGDIPAADWLGVEVLTSVGRGGGTMWRPAD